MIRLLFARLRAEAAFIVLLAVAGAGAWLYVQLRSTAADRDDLLRRAELICASAGGDFAAGKLRRGEACRLKVAALADFKARTDQITAETLTRALAEHDARQLTDNTAARRAAEAARDAAQRMETADAEADRRNLVDREWTAAVNGVAGLHPPR
ncbi:hypothetical protein [Sphingomonas sp. NPDC079357]|uniref:hypothetical protein n=1 Tax=Sphingomonas sp. NPDC079357 TaxID=3364518 RepID=UPI00384E4BD6